MVQETEFEEVIVKIIDTERSGEGEWKEKGFGF